MDIIRSTTHTTIINCLDNHFGRFRVPDDSLRTDNDPNLVSKEVESYLEEMAVAHRHTTPLWPRVSSEVEPEDWSLLKDMRVSKAEGKHWQAELNKFLLVYRSANHSTAGESPAELFF